jgi:hypothetical protein
MPATVLVSQKEQERLDLERLERVAAGGFRGFGEALLALKEIHDRGLYRLVSPYWRDYLVARFTLWGGKRRVNQLVSAATIFSATPAGTVVPTSETQVRPLAGRPVAEAAAVWQEATQGGRAASGARVQAVLDQMDQLPDDLPPQEKLRHIRDEEERSDRLRDRLDRATAVAKIVKLAGRCQALHGLLANEGEADRLLGRYLQAVGAP